MNLSVEKGALHCEAGQNPLGGVCRLRASASTAIYQCPGRTSTCRHLNPPLQRPSLTHQLLQPEGTFRGDLRMLPVWIHHVTKARRRKDLHREGQGPLEAEGPGAQAADSRGGGFSDSCWCGPCPKAVWKSGSLGTGTVTASAPRVGLTSSSWSCKTEAWIPLSLLGRRLRWPWWKPRRLRPWAEAGMSLPVSAEYFAPCSLRASSLCWDKSGQRLQEPVRG